MSYSFLVSKGFQQKFIPKLIQSSQHAQSSQGEPKVQKDYKAEYKKIKVKLTLLKACPPTSQSTKPFQLKNKGLVAETFNWDEEETQVKILMALAYDELLVRKNHARNGEWIHHHEKENPFIPASLDYDHEMVPKSKDWVERLNPDNKLLNFNTERILALESQAVNECLQLIKASTDPKSSKESGPATISDTKPVTSSVPTKVKTNDQESKIDELTKLV
ncbi:hypothetical protein Tco_0455446 [Tanacetum coccineum]